MRSRDEGPGTWVMGCGPCPSETRVKNLRIFEWHDPADDAAVAACPQQGHGEMDGLFEGSYSGTYRRKIRASVCDELSWCKCGSNERVDELMLTFLSWLEARVAYWATSGPSDKTPVSGMNEDVELLLSYIADEHGWTEHGSMVPGWLTDDGEEALANLRKPEFEP